MSISDINFNPGHDASQRSDSRLDQTFGEQNVLSDGRSAKDMREYLAKDSTKKGSIEYNATISGDSIVFGANDLSQRGTTGDAVSTTFSEKDKTIAAQQETIEKQSKEIKEMSGQIAALMKQVLELTKQLEELKKYIEQLLKALQQGGGGTQPGSGDGESQPGAGGDGTQPGAGGDGTQPGAGGDGTQPGAGGDGTQPGAGGDGTQPGAGGDGTQPGTGDGESQPGAGGDSQPEGGETKPETGGDKVPMKGGAAPVQELHNSINWNGSIDYESPNASDLNDGGDGNRYFKFDKDGKVEIYQAPNGSIWMRDPNNPNHYALIDRATGQPYPDHASNPKHSLDGEMSVDEDGTFKFHNTRSADGQKPHTLTVTPDGKRTVVDDSGNTVDQPTDSSVEHRDKMLAAQRDAITCMQKLLERKSPIDLVGKWTGLVSDSEIADFLKNGSPTEQEMNGGKALLAVMKKLGWGNVSSDDLIKGKLDDDFQSLTDEEIAAAHPAA